VPTRVACDVTATLGEAPALFGPQKGASPAEVTELERRFAARTELVSISHKPGSGAAGGLGAALACLGAELLPGAALVLDAVGFDPSGYDLVVTGEGRVDRTTWLGKAPGEVLRRCPETRCVLFGGVVDDAPAGTETVALSGNPGRARADLVELGRDLVTDRH
jgi:glycerate kinase